MTTMETTDPRIDAIRETDPLLKFVGNGTIVDVLDAAEKAGVAIVQEPSTLTRAA